MTSWQDKLASLKKQLQNQDPDVEGESDDSSRELWKAVSANSPLQTLIHRNCQTDEQRNQALRQTAAVDQKNKTLYDALADRTQQMADETVLAVFAWRTRVGGMRGFQELLLPALHPIYGIPYVPASSIKGVIKTWARDHQKLDIDRLLGYLNKEAKEANVAAVQILDAFPTAPCLSVDIANPQWKWSGDSVMYGTVPHPLLSLENLTLKIGLLPTSRGTHNDVLTVKDWLEQALLSEGLGSRVSAGYGRASKVNERSLTTTPLPDSSQHSFELWSQGIYGASTTEVEFRPTAIRAMLRYWFRAVGLAVYSPHQCRDLEDKLFGTIEPRKKVGQKPEAIEGSIRISVDWTSIPDGSLAEGLSMKGTIHLEAKQAAHLKLIQQVLKLATHLGGVGRGARRALHWNDGLRGCYWQLTSESDRLDCDLSDWQKFLNDVKAAFIAVQPAGSPGAGSPGRPGRGSRAQDVLNQYARIYLVPCPKLKHPRTLKNWSTEGKQFLVRGRALEFLYSSGYKGVNRAGEGNRWVGGNLGTPSFVWIASNNLHQPEQAYQVITLFGVDQDDPEKHRQQFINDLLAKEKGIISIVLPF